MFEVYQIDDNGNIMERYVAQGIEGNETRIQVLTGVDSEGLNVWAIHNKSDYITEPIPQGMHVVKRINGNWIEGATIDFLEIGKEQKIAELFSSYESEKYGDVISSLIGSDNSPIVFAYSEHNQNDYTKIGTKLALNPTLTESIIGSKSHGKFYITREDFSKLVADFDNHEVTLYTKFVDKRNLVNAATTVAGVEAIVW